MKCALCLYPFPDSRQLYDWINGGYGHNPRNSYPPPPGDQERQLAYGVFYTLTPVHEVELTPHRLCKGVGWAFVQSAP